jgi:uncharacterized protein
VRSFVQTVTDSCHTQPTRKRRRIDYLLWASVSIIVLAFVFTYIIPLDPETQIGFFAFDLSELVLRMTFALLLGVVFVGLLSQIPREVVVGVLGTPGTTRGLIRATIAGVLLDLCSHGIILVGMGLYKRGASLGQTVAFLVASPWNSLSLTFVLWALIGLQWTLAILGLSFVIAMISGLVCDRLVRKGILPKNPNTLKDQRELTFVQALGKAKSTLSWSPSFIGKHVLWQGLKDSKMILRWIFFGFIVAVIVRTFVSPDQFATLFGPTLGGLGLTLLVATVLEVCSEGSAPIAADILTRAHAPGNAFGFLMAGVSTDYTEIVALKETTKSWKIALFLPLITLPQVIVVSYLMNML